MAIFHDAAVPFSSTFALSMTTGNLPRAKHTIPGDLGQNRMTTDEHVDWRCVECREPFTAPDAQTATCPYCDTVLKIPDEAWDYYRSKENRE